MAAVSLLRAGYEKKLRDEQERRAAVEEQWRRTDAERALLLREREALRRILLGVTVGRGACARHARSGRSRSADSRPQARTLHGRVQQLREEIHSQRRLLAELEGELRRRDEAMRGMEEESISARERERVLVERLQEAVELSDGGAETERILRAELDYAQSRLAAVSPSRVQQAAAAAAAAENAAFDMATNEGVLQRLQEVEQLLAENESREEAQARMLEEMGEQISLVITDRDEALARARRFENKYQKAKADVGAWMEAVERLTDNADASGRLADGRSGLQRARDLHAAAEERAAAAAAAAERERREMDDTSSSHLLLRMVEDERAIARSLHQDLDETRKMLLDRDAEVHALAAQLSEARVTISAEYTRAELERGRADEAAAASHADTTAYAGALDDSQQENGALIDKERFPIADYARLSDTLKQCASYAAKLEAQGRDLIAVKKELQRLQLQQP